MIRILVAVSAAALVLLPACGGGSPSQNNDTTTGPDAGQPGGGDPGPVADGGSNPDGGSTDGGSTDGGSTDGGTGPLACAELTEPNVLAPVSGAAMGTGAQLNTDLRREIPMDISANPNGFSIPHAYLVRPDSTSNEVQLIAEIRNDGSVTQCGVIASNVKWEDSALKVYENDSTVVALGSVGVLQAPSSRCLTPGETGYVIAIHTDDPSAFDLVESIHTDGVTVRAASAGRPQASLEAVGYSAGDSTLSLTVRNAGPDSAKVTFGALVLLDASGAPLYAVTASPPSSASSVAPGQTVEVTKSSFAYAGSASVLRGFVVYQDDPACTY